MVKAYRHDGFVKIPGLISTEWQKRLREGIEQNLAKPGPNAHIINKDDAGNLFFEDAGTWQQNLHYRDYCMTSDMPEIAAILTGSKTLRLFFDNLFVKDHGLCAPTPWHQDLPYTPLMGTFCGLWGTLDQMPRRDSIEFIRGSHRWKKSYRPTEFTTRSLGQERTGFESLEMLPDIENNRHEYDIVGWDLKPGDGIAFDGSAIHSSSSNTSGHRRHAFIVRYALHGARYLPKGGNEYPKFPNCGLFEAEPLEGPSFPAAWPLR